MDRYLQKIATTVKPELMILLTTGAAAGLPKELLLPLFRPSVTAAGLNPDVLVMADFPDRALVKVWRCRLTPNQPRLDPGFTALSLSD